MRVINWGIWFRLTIAIGFSCPPSASRADTKPPEPGAVIDDKGDKAKLHVYVDRTRLVYWPIDLPIFVRLQASPEDGKESFLLEQAELKSLSQGRKEINEGLKLEIAGTQFIRWINHLSKDEVMYRFVADGGPPTTKITYDKATRIDVGGRIFFGPGLEARIVATDEQAGVNEVFLSVDKKPYDLHKGPVLFLEQKTYHVDFYANDLVGYQAAVKSADFTVDLSPPASSAEIKDNFEGSVLSDSSRIFIKSTDTGAGVATIYFKFNNQVGYQNYAAAEGISLNGLSDGSQILKYYAEDKVNNREVPKELQFYLDKAPPSVAFTLSGDSFVNDKSRFISPRTRIRLDASDSQVRVAKIFYGFSGKTEEAYSSPFAPPVNDGEVVLKYHARDSLGNESAGAEVKFIVDSTAPQTVREVRGRSSLKDSNVIYLGLGGQINIEGKDDKAGVKQIEFQLNEAAPQLYSGAIVPESEGRFLLRYWATDNVNNQNTVTSILVINDRTAPEIVETFSSEPVGIVESAKKEKVGAYTTGTTLNLAARDSAAGVQDIEFASGTDEKFTPYEKVITFNSKGSYALRVRTKDHVGNRAEKVINFVIVDHLWKATAH